MTVLIEDFVNREEHLATLWKIIRREVDQRALLIRGPAGIGKTYLLEECRARCAAERIACMCVDFAATLDRGYLAIVQAMYVQLGSNGFQRLFQAFEVASSQSAWPAPPLAADKPSSGRSGGVDMSGPTTVMGDVAGRDIINYIQQIDRRDDPLVQRRIQSQVTAALHECLVELAATHTLVFLLDSWQDAPTDTCNWLNQNLLSWIVEKQLPQAMVVVAGRAVPDLRGPAPRIRQVALAELPEPAVRAYWVEKYRLPPEDVPNIFKYSGGLPLLVAMMAQRQAG
jgi:hypothetical protein